MNREALVMSQEKKESGNRIALSKKVYAAPTLSEYGTVSKLTRSGGSTTNDFGPMTSMMMSMP
jgi:hypothetical protein